MEESIDKVLNKKAKGFHYLETIDEYSEEEGVMRLVRRKVSRKYSPPDLAAIKAVSEADVQLEELSTEELEALREQLLKQRADQCAQSQPKKQSKEKQN